VRQQVNATLSQIVRHHPNMDVSQGSAGHEVLGGERLTPSVARHRDPQGI
jgi:hypothetical protein